MGTQLHESSVLVMLGLIPPVRAVFVGVPVVIVLVALVVVTLVVLALSIFAIPIVLWAGRSHHRNRCSKSSGQKKRTEISISTVHVGLLWRETHIRRIPLRSLSTLDGSKSGQYCSDVPLGFNLLAFRPRQFLRSHSPCHSSSESGTHILQGFQPPLVERVRTFHGVVFCLGSTTPRGRCVNRKESW